AGARGGAHRLLPPAPRGIQVPAVHRLHVGAAPGPEWQALQAPAARALLAALPGTGDLLERIGKGALVTGASRGVGSATAVALAEAGCDVACAARSTADQPQRTPGTLEETVARIEDAGGKGLAVPANLAVDDDVVRMVATTVEHFGRL